MRGTKTVCWVQHASEWPLCVSVARVLQERDISSIFVCKSRTAHGQYQREGFESYFVPDALDRTSDLTESTLDELDLIYGPPGIRAIGDSDMQTIAYFRERHAEKYQLIAQTYRFWERFLSEHAVDAFVAPETAAFLTRTLYNVARKRSIPFGQLVIGPSHTTFVVDDVDESHVWSGLLNVLEGGVRVLTDEQREAVHDFIEGRGLQSRGGLSLRFVPASLFTSLRQYAGMWFYDRPSARRADPVRVAALRYGRRRLVKRILWKYVTQPFFSYDTPRAGEKYVYFPVYSGEETSYLVNDHYWARNEVSLMREVAQSLPFNHKLYVKEHPFNPGDLTYPQLRTLKSISNVRVLHPSFPNHELIENSSAVFVLQGTIGWEAFLAKKPVVSMSKPFFAYSPLIYKVRQLSELPSVLWQAIRNSDALYREREDEWLWFIHSVMATAGKGMTVRHTSPYGFVRDRENAESIAAYIASHLLKEKAPAT